jgi:uncharacterized protein YdeI (YjbR/CyaY-like superfamily)
MKRSVRTEKVRAFFYYEVMKPKFFATAGDFRKWLDVHHATESELLVGFHKVKSGKPSMTWSESVDQALCFGWIDGVRKRIDDESYTIRFTPRRSGSIWSAINIEKVAQLKKRGLMRPAGAAAFKKRTDAKSAIYSYEKAPEELDPEYERLFQKRTEAWKFFQEQPPGYRKLTSHYVMAAKNEKTRMSRLEKLILASENRKRL